MAVEEGVGGSGAIQDKERPREYVSISYILTKEEWERLCKAKWTPMAVMDLLNIYPREFQIEKLDSQGYSEEV